MANLLKEQSRVTISNLSPCILSSSTFDRLPLPPLYKKKKKIILIKVTEDLHFVKFNDQFFLFMLLNLAAAFDTIY